MTTATDILQFWYEEIDSRNWFQSSDAFDAVIRERFADCHRQATRCELADWRNEPRGRLAEVIVLDQFSRNLYRDDARAFAADPLALALAQEAIRTGDDRRLSQRERYFLYMPFMHSESAVIHEEAVRLFESIPEIDALRWEIKHKAIIDRFGRYPHRNAVLGRDSTPDELEFLRQPGSSF